MRKSNLSVAPPACLILAFSASSCFEFVSEFLANSSATSTRAEQIFIAQKVAVCLKALTELSARPVSSCTIMSIIRLSKITDDLHFMIRA
ncbi:hypothetical protein WR25_16838 [Diploscapter pachys]|uniref:Uncharacterized protein n=1 Tax=Diploscapter pachys TaxID=2018661 RepID=A0A2A2LZ45_9BILA|nr:hypothetical protein WR25_16838 [Diploscapter pachys]